VHRRGARGHVVHCCLSAALFASLLLAPAHARQEAIDEANAVLAARVDTLAAPDRPGRLRMQLSTDPVIDAMVQWDESGEQLFPPPARLPHTSEDRMLADLARLEALRSSPVLPAWERRDRGSDRYYRCSAYRCLQVNGTALMEAMGRHPASHSALVGDARSDGFSSSGLAAASILGLAIVGVAMLRLRSRTSPPQHEVSGPKPPVDPLSGAFTFGHATIRPREMLISDGFGDREISSRELSLLRYFADNPGAVLSKDALYDAGWGRNYQPGSRALDQQVLTLRRKLDPQRREDSLIETVHGEGYRFRG